DRACPDGGGPLVKGLRTSPRPGSWTHGTHRGGEGHILPRLRRISRGRQRRGRARWIYYLGGRAAAVAKIPRRRVERLDRPPAGEIGRASCRESVWWTEREGALSMW